MKIFVFTLALLMPLIAFAEKDYVNGGYWTVTSVDTKEGHFDAYISDLKKFWRKSIEAMKKDGKIESYQIFSNVHARTGEPDLWLVVQWRSGAELLDTPDKYVDAQTEELFGSYDKGTEAMIARGDLRTIMSTVLMREIDFN